MAILLSLKESLSAAQSNFTPNAFILMLSISMAPGPKLGSTGASTGRKLLIRVSTKRIHPKLFRDGSLAQRHDRAPGRIGDTRACRKVT